MTELRLNLSDEALKFLEIAAAESGCASSSEYIENLIQVERRRCAHERIEEIALEGVRSGEPIEATPEFWDERSRQLRERTAQERVP